MWARKATKGGGQTRPKMGANERTIQTKTRTDEVRTIEQKSQKQVKTVIPPNETSQDSIEPKPKRTRHNALTTEESRDGPNKNTRNANTRNANTRNTNTRTQQTTNAAAVIKTNPPFLPLLPTKVNPPQVPPLLLKPTPCRHLLLIVVKMKSR